MGVIDRVRQPLLFCDDGPPRPEKLLNGVEHLLVNQLKTRGKNIISLIFRQSKIDDRCVFDALPAIFADPVLLGAVAKLWFEKVYMKIGLE